MTDHNAHIYTTSVMNVTKRFAHYGEGDINDLSLLKLCYKYACYADDYESLQKINKIVSDLQMKNPDICMDFSNIDGFPSSIPEDFPTFDSSNTAPTVDGKTVTILGSSILYTFSLSDFTTNFADAEGHGIGKITIKSIPIQPLLYNGIQVIIGQEISTPSLLTYDRVGATAYTNTFNFSIFDNYLDDPKESIDTTILIDVLISDNQAATIGDNTIYPGNRVTTVLTLAMFTTNLSPQYSDPEGDLIDAIRIDEISDANTGVYYLSGNPISVGDIITREQLEAGLFTHEAEDTDAISSDVINFSARDEGSQIWVQ